jgi:hypothetical protein
MATLSYPSESVSGGVRRAIGTRHRRTARHRGVRRDDARSYVTAGLRDLLRPFRFRAPPWEEVLLGQRAGDLTGPAPPGASRIRPATCCPSRSGSSMVGNCLRSVLEPAYQICDNNT